jgi:hypothetical protein
MLLDPGEFDSLKGIVLRQLETIASRVGDGIGVGFYQDLLDTMYSDLETMYMQDTENFRHGVDISLIPINNC